jgi:hypothetical protein
MSSEISLNYVISLVVKYVCIISIRFVYYLWLQGGVAYGRQC